MSPPLKPEFVRVFAGFGAERLGSRGAVSIWVLIAGGSVYFGHPTQKSEGNVMT